MKKQRDGLGESIILNGTTYKVERDANGKAILIEDRRAKLAKMPVNKRIAARNSKKTRPAKPGEISA